MRSSYFRNSEGFTCLSVVVGIDVVSVDVIGGAYHKFILNYARTYGDILLQCADRSLLR